MDIKTDRHAPPTARPVQIPVGGAVLDGELVFPEPQAQEVSRRTGVVIFAHGSGSSRHSPRNQRVARELRNYGVATLLFDLLTRQEEAADARTAHLRFDIPMLAERLTAAAGWLQAEDDFRGRQPAVGLFGASTGAAAALITAADIPDQVSAVVSRGGRPDLAGPALGRVRAASLLIVGGDDGQVIELNKRAYDRLHCEKQLKIIPGASHLFEEPGTLDHVAVLAGDWFRRHLLRKID